MAAAIVDGNANSVYPTPAAGGRGGKLRLMCSYGGHIVPRPYNGSLCYLGGETRVVSVHRRITLAELSAVLSRLVGAAAGTFSIKYRLPCDDLDSLVSVATEDDLEVMLDEYDRIAAAKAATSKPSQRLRLFLFPSKSAADAGIGDRSRRREPFVEDLLGLDGNDPNPSSSTPTKMKPSGDGQGDHSSPNSAASSSCSGSFVQPASGGWSEEHSGQTDVLGQKQDEGPGNAAMTATCSTEIPSQSFGVFSSDDDSRTSPKEIHNHVVDSSDQTSRMQTTEQSHHVHSNPNVVQFQHHQITSTPVVPLQSYYTPQPLLHTHLYNPQMPVYFLPIQPNPTYTLPIQQCDSSEAATMIHPPGNPDIPLPSPSLLPRGINLPTQKHESTTTSGNRSIQDGNVPDQNQQYMSCYYQIPRYISQPPLTTDYCNHSLAMTGPLSPQCHTKSSEGVAKSISGPSATLQQPDLQQPRSSS